MKTLALTVLLFGLTCSSAQERDCSNGTPICPKGHICTCKQDVLKCKPGQQVKDVNGSARCVDPASVPLKCNKYERAVYHDNHCGSDNAECDHKTGWCTCPDVPPDTCVPIIRSVSEKDWQELLVRVKALEILNSKE